MHRRNSSSEFGRDAAPRRPVGAARRRCQRVLPYLYMSCSRALNPERKAAVGNAAYIHKRGVGILEQTLNDGFRFVAIHNLRVDDVVIRIVSAKHAARAKVGGVFINCAVRLTPVDVNKDRACLRIRVTRRNRCVRKQNDPLAGIRPTQAVPARSASGRIYCDERVIRCTRVYCAPRCVGNFGRKRNDVEAGGFHERQLNPTSRAAHRRNSGSEFLSFCRRATPHPGSAASRAPTKFRRRILLFL